MKMHYFLVTNCVCEIEMPSKPLIYTILEDLLGFHQVSKTFHQFNLLHFSIVLVSFKTFYQFNILDHSIFL